MQMQNCRIGKRKSKVMCHCYRIQLELHNDSEAAEIKSKNDGN